MRLLHTFNDKNSGEKFSAFLKSEGIDNVCETQTNTDWGSSDYGCSLSLIWIIEEDQIDIADRWLQEYTNNPRNPLFAKVEAPASQKEYSLKTLSSRKPLTITAPNKPKLQQAFQDASLTLYVFLACIFLFLIGEITTPNIEVPPLHLPLVALYSPPINKTLMYDYPQAYAMMDKFIKIYGKEGLQNYDNLPPEGKFLLNKIIQTPVWEGYYASLEYYFSQPKPPVPPQAMLFEKIRQGEIWRLFTPCLLHANLLHLFLNMLWLVYIGKIIETRLGTARYLLLILLTAIVSNTTQYLMSGPNFLGFSGVLCGMLAFSWGRQKMAPWEGYRLAPGTYSFIFITIMAMAAIQIISFFIKAYFHIDFFPSIANTAHISGGIAGYLLGRSNLMGIKN